jgi:osmotically-inducible protein OsmY
MKTDAQLRNDVIHELEWDPSINAAHVSVAAQDGVVTLTGHLKTFAELYDVERAVQRVAGVKAVAVHLEVKLAPEHRRSDSEVAEAVEAAFKWNVLIPAERIGVKVENGWVTLTGEVEWEYQRSSAAKAVRSLTGVVGVSNDITLKPGITPADVSTRIRQALERHAQREAKHIEVLVSGSTVTLRGKVDSWAERVAASGAVWAAPGIGRVINELRVGRAA